MSLLELLALAVVAIELTNVRPVVVVDNYGAKQLAWRRSWVELDH